MNLQSKTLALCAAVALCSTSPPMRAQSAPNPKAFAATAASSNMFEFEWSELALDQGIERRSARVRSR
jgi:predicted outer membrane protein